ncbi:TRAP-type mannitol/chloroaromatic compound transport system, small permease component [Monaibacterium marinum]|uniref:TRAP transporter small permease protein n=1 Tax=Pontivivens marinum TaxID=1690039 RepID=A0A2C9CM68_9RHOB|nr:TRAP transporter small permease subunit [Monaibacterium marinum]SOH92280.1 TRAP-type mannitol/chloroaromatic compound transport system, small permease component [Monaibacterium marinum]
MTSEDDFVAITDPGEIARAEQTPIDRFVVAVSNIASWMWPILVIAICSQVILRSLGHNQAWLDDLQWWIYGVAIIIGVAFAVTTKSHVRVDIFHANFAPEKKARIEVFGLAWLFLPFIILAWDVSFHYAVTSVASGEGSSSPNGLHHLYLLKSVSNVTFLFVGIATWAAYYRELRRLTVPHLWKQMLFALPSTMFLINLGIYYSLYWVIRLFGSDELEARRITREPIFDTTTVLGVEVLWTMLFTFIATPLLIGAAYALRRKS